MREVVFEEGVYIVHLVQIDVWVGVNDGVRCCLISFNAVEGVSL